MSETTTLPPVIDVHAHIYPERVAPLAVTSISNFYHRVPMHHDGTIEDLLAAGKRAGVRRHLIFSCATSLHQVQSINNFIIKECAAAPELIGLGTIQIGYEDYEAEFDRLYAAGIRGIKIHPDFQEFYLDDERMMPIYRSIADHHMFLLAHSGDYRYEYSSPTRLARVARALPQLDIIAAHLGGWMCWKEARQQLVTLPNMYMDTCSVLGFVGDEPLQQLLEVYDHTHIFFGTDYPMWDAAEEIARLRAAISDPALLADILYYNFRRFYQRYAPEEAAAF